MGDLTTEQRQELYQRCGNLMGEKLVKEVQEIITHYRIRRTTITFSAGGGYIPMAEAKDKYEKKKPDMWKNIQDHGQTLTCPIQGLMVQIPQYEARKLDEEIDSEEARLKLQASGKLKKPKAPKPEKDGAEGGPGKRRKTGEDKPEFVEVTEKQIQRVERSQVVQRCKTWNPYHALANEILSVINSYVNYTCYLYACNSIWWHIYFFLVCVSLC